jgi:hypothetical protein
VGPVPERLIAKLGRDLEELDVPIRRWLDARERAFAAAFARKEGPLKEIMGRLPKAAAGAAGVGAGPRERVYAILDELCDLYTRADPAACATIRGLVQAREARHLLGDYVSNCTRVLDHGGRPEMLDRGLAAASIDDQGSDYRDWLMSLGDLYLAAHTHGLVPGPMLQRTAERSSAEKPRGGPTPTREVLAGFEKSAYFITSIAPRIG